MQDKKGSAPPAVTAETPDEGRDIAPFSPSEEPDAIKEAISALRPLLRDPQQAPQAVTRIIEIAEEYSGPLPHPRHFEKYEAVLPGSAREILGMAKKEQAHRHRTQNLELSYPYVGMLLGFIAFLACIAAAVFLTIWGREGIAWAFVGVPVVGVISWFVNSRISLSNPAPPTQQNTSKQPQRPPRRGR